MKQLASALHKAGFSSSHELRTERDRLLVDLVATDRAIQKARKARRKVKPLVETSSKLRSRVAEIAPSLRGLTTLLVLVFMAIPGFALAHPGHGDHGESLDPQGAIVVVGLTLGLAVHAWKTWGDKRQAKPATDTTDKGEQS